MKEKGQKPVRRRLYNEVNHLKSKRRSSAACKRREARRERRTTIVELIVETPVMDELFYSELAYEEYCHSVYRIDIDPFEECFEE